MPGQESILFNPLTIGGLELAGRLVKTATSETRATEDGFASEKLMAFYAPIAQAGTPLIITGNIYTSRDGQSTANQLGADSDDKIPALRLLSETVHRRGSKIFAQLNHCGRQLLPAAVGLDEALSASNVKDLATGTRPRPLDIGEIRRIVDDFGEAALRCKKAGFDGVQIHAAHGYLINQFLTPYTNRRKDEYGGPLENRVKLLRDVYHAMRNRVGKDFPLIVKINGSDYLPFRPGLKTNELVEVACIMEREGIDAIEISVGHYESGFPMVRGTFLRCFRAMLQGSIQFLPLLRRLFFTLFWPLIAVLCGLIWHPYQGFNLRYARHFKKALSIPVICVGGFLTRDKMESAIEKGYCDAISCGRSFIADPFLYQHLRDNVPGPQCVFCNACIGHVGSLALDCYHPEVRRQKDAMLEAAMPVEAGGARQFAQDV